MNIALIASSALISRKEATWLTIFSLAKEYTKHGHKVVISAEKNDSLPEVEEVEGIKVYRLHKGKIFSGRRSIQNISKRENISFDIIHGFSSSPFMALNTFLAKKNFPKAKAVHTIKSYSKHQMTRNLLPHLLVLMDAVTVPTQKLRANITNQGSLQSKVKVIFSPIDIHKFKPRPKETLKEKHGYQGKKIVLYYGAIRKQKGVDYLIQAVPLIKDPKKEIEFIFAIRSKAEEKKNNYLMMARNLGCEDRIKIILEDLPIEEYVSMADMVVLAYPNLIGTEGNPSCLLESMAAKTPVVTTNLAELREIVAPEKDVLMAAPKDVPSLAAEITKLLKDEKLAQRLAENAFKKSKQFDIKIISKQFLELYQSLIPINE